MKRLIKKILKESDDFGWIKKIPSGIELKYSNTYYINCCETGYDEETFLKKYIELFGKPWEHKTKKDLDKNKSYYVNWFNNVGIINNNHKVILILSDDKGGWNSCGSRLISPNVIEITPKQFLNSWNSFNLVESEEGLEWIKDVDEPFIITTTPFNEVDTYDRQHRYWVSKGVPIKVGDFAVYQTASGIWREYGIMNPEKVDEANEDEDFYKVIII